MSSLVLAPPDSTTRRGWSLDPRTKLLTLMVINALVMGNSTFTCAMVCAGITAVLLTSTNRPRALATYVFCFSASTLVFLGLPALWHAPVAAVIAAVGFWIARFSVAIGLAAYLVISTSPAQLSAALTALRLPASVVVPISVMLRFLPTALNELRSIVEAMKLRGLFPGAAGILAHPVRTAEFIVVPMLAATTHIADDLSASALIRGLGCPDRPTSIVKLGFRPVDALTVTTLVGLAALSLSGWELPW